MEKLVSVNGIVFKVPIKGSLGLLVGNGFLYQETIDSDVETTDINSAAGYLVLFGEPSVISGGQHFDLPVGLAPGSKRVGWKKAENILDDSMEFPHANAQILDNGVRKVWSAGEFKDKIIDTPYTSTIKIDNGLTDKFSDFSSHSDIQRNSEFVGIMNFADLKRDFLWGQFSYFADIKPVIPYYHPEWKDVTTHTLWENGVPIERHLTHKFKTGIVTDIHHQTMWGPYWYSLWCESVYYPPDGCQGVPFRLVDDPQWGVCEQLNMYIGPRPNVRCPWIHKHSGVRDQYIKFPTPPPPSFAPFAWVYYMMNTISLKRLPDNTYIDCYSVDVQTDMESWVWDFSIVLPDKSYLDLVKPQIVNGNVVLMDVEVMINGWKWVCKIESFQESRSFGNKAWTVRGRSTSVELAAPYSLPGIYTNTEARQGNQLITDVLQYTGWDVHWGFANNASTYSDILNPTTDWLIPANTMSISDKTRIQALQHIIEGIGARIITNPNCINAGKFFTIIPRYNKTPWHWVTDPVDYLLHENACWEMARSYESKPRINSVLVSGENIGAIVNATVNGTAGNLPASMVTHQLITTQAAGAEKAKSILSNSGVWTQHTLKLFSLDDFVDPQGLFPGLILPGKMIQLEEGGVAWKGQVTSVQIHGESVSGNKGVEVTQTLGVEQYHG